MSTVASVLLAMFKGMLPLLEPYLVEAAQALAAETIARAKTATLPAKLAFAQPALLAIESKLEGFVTPEAIAAEVAKLLPPGSGQSVNQSSESPAATKITGT